VLFGQLLVPVVVYEEIVMPNTPHTLHVYLTIYGTSFVQWNTAFIYLDTILEFAGETIRRD
jgi:hypothetical protein